MARLECSAVCQMRLQSLFQFALQLYRSGLAAKTCKHPSCFSSKFEFPMKNTAKHNRIDFNAPSLFQLPFLLTLMRLRLLQKSCAALQFLLFLLTVKLPSYTSRTSAKDLLNFPSPVFSLSNIGGILNK